MAADRSSLSGTGCRRHVNDIVHVVNRKSAASGSERSGSDHAARNDCAQRRHCQTDLQGRSRWRPTRASHPLVKSRWLFARQCSPECRGVDYSKRVRIRFRNLRLHRHYYYGHCSTNPGPCHSASIAVSSSTKHHLFIC